MPDMPAPAPSMTLLNLIAGSWMSQAISVAAKLGIADLLEDGPRSADDLSRATETHPDTLYRLLRALAGLRIFAEDDDGRFELTPLAEGLRTKAPVSLCGYAILLGEEWYWRAWGQLLHSVRTGECAFERVFGLQVFEYLARHPQAAQVFDAAMTSRGSMEDRAVAAVYDFARGTIVDVGGGRGSLLIAILRRNPQTRGILFDRPHVTAGAAAPVGEAGLADRCRIVAGDFFDGVPAGGDIYLMKKIIHDWDDERARAILANCRAAMAGNGRLLLLEQVILPGNGSAFGNVADLQMLVMTPGGRERTEAQYRTLLAAAGLELARIIPTECPLSIIEAMPR
jgi:O-methyltransferase domain/Dimerisation domain